MKTRFPEFRDAIAAGADPLTESRVRMATDGRYSLVYTPFETVTRTARLAIVGQTPGPEQLQPSYRIVRDAIAANKTEAEVLAAAHDKAAFDGNLRKPLLRMLRHFGFAQVLGIRDEADLWDGESALLHATSIIPHAAFKRGKFFSGSEFSEVWKSPILRNCFETCFVPTLAMLDPACRFIGLGPLVSQALAWCVKQGLLRPEQRIGTLPHPSRHSGSQVAVFLKERTVAELKPKDPVRRGSWAARLDQDYAEMAASVAAWRQKAIVEMAA